MQEDIEKKEDTGNKIRGFGFGHSPGLIDIENPVNVFRATNGTTARILKVEEYQNLMKGRTEHTVTVEMEYADGKKKVIEMTGERLMNQVNSGDWKEIKD